MLLKLRFVYEGEAELLNENSEGTKEENYEGERERERSYPYEVKESSDAGKVK